jgi:hypothetical protein
MPSADENYKSLGSNSCHLITNSAENLCGSDQDVSAMDAAYGASHSLSLLSLRTVLKATGHDRARIVPHARPASPPVVCKLVPELIRSRLFLIAWRSSGGAVPSLWIVLLCPLT